MLNVYHFWGILVPVLGIFVTLIIALLKFSRNTVTKADLNNNMESLRSDINRRFDEAAADREAIRAEAAADRQKISNEVRDQCKDIKTEMSEKFNLAHVERQKINGEIIRQNQNYIEHLVHHNTQRPKPAPDEDDST